MGIYQNFEYTQWQTEQRESIKTFPFLMTETYLEDENIPERAVPDNRLWKFIDKSGNNTAISPFIPVPTEPKKECSGLPSFSGYVPEFDPKKTYQGETNYLLYRNSSQAVLYNYATMLSANSNNQQNDCLTGKLKFFDDAQQYGFFVLDRDGTDLFVHQDDLEKSGINIDSLQKYKDAHFSFHCMTYYGKYQLSRKAVNIKIMAKEILRELKCN